MRRGVLWTLVSLLTFMSATVGAQTEAPEPPLGGKGHVAIAAERMFGFVHATQTTSTSGGSGSTTISNNAISLLGSPVNAVASVYTFPRVAFDVFVAPGISVGGSVSYFHLSEGLTVPGSTSDNNATISGFVASPRIGFVGQLGPSVAVWPRAGITYVNFSSDSTFGPSQQAHNTTTLLAATIEAPLAVAVIPHALLLIGPTVDIGLSGTMKNNSGAGTTDVSADAKETDFGLQGGILLFL